MPFASYLADVNFYDGGFCKVHRVVGNRLYAGRKFAAVVKHKRVESLRALGLSFSSCFRSHIYFLTILFGSSIFFKFFIAVSIHAIIHVHRHVLIVNLVDFAGKFYMAALREFFYERMRLGHF